ncbi:hypothetical protein SD70_07445 [Gordoniibacillus kamchatkensis]|uniref:Extracellular solute-binding protein n=1 Tax=Gordoniibacillus kamchatkensis TaxID=1590651 RepID=A0ABR5AK91_9BACL|nr:extracellular solute-binding protein [Paenibacillus sp. VKM B-2647]KIL41458.1 hypothetical protein SD70_07445 [Paenibacillus sp. VKM B-2647]
MKTKSWLAVLSCTSLLVLAACSGNSGDSVPPGKSSAVAPQTEGSKGNKLLDKPITIHVLSTDTSPPVNTKSPVFDYIFERTNVRLDLELAATNYAQRAQTIVATNSLPDVMKIPNGSPYFAEAAKNGLFLPLDDYMADLPNLSKIMKQDKEIEKNKVDGKLYSFPVLGQWKLQLAQAPMMRVDLLQELGLSVPKTFNELYQVLKKMKEKYPDSIPFTSREGAKNLLRPLAFALGSGNRMYFDPAIDGGKYVYGQAHPEFKAVLEYVHKLYAEKLLDPDYAVNTGDQMKEKLSAGKAFFYYDNNSFGVNFNTALLASNPKAKFDLLPLMQNDRGQTRNWMYAKDWLHHFVISAKAKNPKEIVKFFDWLYSDEGTLITNYGIEGKHFKMVGGKPVIEESVIKEFANTKDPYRYMQNTLGVGFLAFSLNVDEHPMAVVSPPELSKWAEQIVPDKGYVYELFDPPFTSAESAKLKTLQSKVDTLVDQEMDKFIIGTRPLSDYDKFIQQLKDSGALEIEKIYNDAYVRLMQQSK